MAWHGRGCGGLEGSESFEHGAAGLASLIPFQRQSLTRVALGIVWVRIRQTGNAGQRDELRSNEETATLL